MARDFSAERADSKRVARPVYRASAHTTAFCFPGLTMALLTGYQLQRFGTERLVPGLVAIAFTRELGPLLTGIMLAARIGAAFTAELGTMQVSEEVEAIEAMGISPLRFLVAPRMLALFSLMPCLSTISSAAAIFATSLICRAY